MHAQDAELIQKIDLKPTGSGPERRIPVFVLMSERLQETLDDLPRFLDSDDLKSVFVVAPIPAPTASGWPHVLRFQQVATDEILARKGCLCCDLRSEITLFLGQLFMSLLARRQARVSAVLVLTQAQETTALRDALEHAPFLAQRYVLAGALYKTTEGFRSLVMGGSASQG